MEPDRVFATSRPNTLIVVPSAVVIKAGFGVELPAGVLE
jgi:hypothetical protein